MLYARIPALTALDRLNGSQAVALGVALSLGGKKDKHKREALLRREAKAAGLEMDEDE